MKEQKNKLKNILLLFTSLVIVSCSEDLYEHEIQKNDSGYKITDKSFEELRKDKKFMKAYSEINSYGNSNSKTVMEQNYNFTISNIPAKVIEKNGKASYTFHIVRDTINNDYFENLIVGSDSLNQTTAYIAKYKKDFTKPSLINNVPFTKINVNSIIYDNSTAKVTECIEKVYSLCNGIPYDCGGSICGFGSFTLCSGSGGGGDYGSGISWGGGGTSTTPIGGGSSSNMENFYSNLQFNQQEWLDNQSSETQQSLFNYLNTNGFTTANKNKIKNLINVAMTTGTTFTIDPTITATNSQVFNSSSDLEAYLNAGNSSNSSTQVNNINLGERISKAVFDLGIFINLELSVKQNTNPFSVTAVTSEITGITLGKEWHQTNSTTNNTVGFPNSAEVDVYGNMVHFIFLEGIGTVFTASEHFQIKFLKNNGSIYATFQY